MHFNERLCCAGLSAICDGVAEVRKVLDFVRLIKTSGRACVYIEHNLAHIHEVADRMIVVDRGRIVSEVRPKDMSVADLTEYLVQLQKQT